MKEDLLNKIGKKIRFRKKKREKVKTENRARKALNSKNERLNQRWLFYEKAVEDTDVRKRHFKWNKKFLPTDKMGAFLHLCERPETHQGTLN